MNLVAHQESRKSQVKDQYEKPENKGENSHTEVDGRTVACTEKACTITKRLVISPTRRRVVGGNRDGVAIRGVTPARMAEVSAMTLAERWSTFADGLHN
ncbi:hypothetical protein L1987_40743 [Smallanthus sonchifolius]|uniref:Uncharacterized protein n=1 Tax=Smallanthus sonchifolius TaxID=185202 RepID=A0ACB9GUQ9_9ASTR|nr:hypothetical protein L1987_40743 [Smallanthus sonchifolius]